jgi:hypothetical protein
MKLTGFAAISYAEREGLTLNKSGDHIDPPRHGLTIAEAEAIASDAPDLIWLEVPKDEYYGEQKNMEPER